MAAKTGFGAFVGFGRQTVLGTTVARTVFGSFLSETIKREQPYVFPVTLRTPSAPRGIQVAPVLAKGGLSFMAAYVGLEVLLKDALGAVATTTLASTAKQHDFSLATDLPSPGLSIEIERRNAAFLYADCKVTKLSFKGDPKAEFQLMADIIGRAETNPSVSTPTYPTVRPISSPQITTLTVDGSAVTLDSFEFVIDNKLTSEAKLGIATGSEPLRTDQREVTGSFQLDFESVAASSIYDKFKSGATAALLWVAQGDVVAGADKFELRWSFPTIIFTGETPVVGGPGIIKQKVTFRAVASAAGGNDEMTARLVNDTATVI